MLTVNIHEAKTHLSRLIDAASRGKSFIIAKAGKPLVRVEAISAPETSEKKRLGFLMEKFQIPDDFNTLGEKEISRLFSGEEERL